MQLQYVQLHIIITTAAYLIIVSSICLRDSSFKSLSFQQMMATPFSPPAPPALHVKAKNNFLCLINDLHLSSSLICMKELKRSSKKEGSLFLNTIVYTFYYLCTWTPSLGYCLKMLIACSNPLISYTDDQGPQYDLKKQDLISIFPN